MGAETHNIPPGTRRIKIRSFSVRVRWLGGKSLHTTKSISHIFVGVVFKVSSQLYDFCCGSDCKYLRVGLIFYECCGMQTSNSDAVEWVPCVDAVDGACCS
jgi:hypothetical protein